MTAIYRYAAEGEQRTAQLARALAALAWSGAVLAVDGDLGAGKTRFAQALAESLGVTDVVNSPTFTIIKEYEGSGLPFYHMDVYRISAQEAGELGLEEYFDGLGVTLIEWASRVAELLPDDRLEIGISVTGAEDREFALAPYGERWERACEKLKENGMFNGDGRGDGHGDGQGDGHEDRHEE
jgi:tRNA threonylcarbamoyladenosine biosynthesis protein TsaE